MDRANILLYGVAVLLSISLLSGCSSNDYNLCLQEKESLQKTIEDQQGQLDVLKVQVDGNNTLIEKMSTQLQQCHQQRVKLMQERAKAGGKKVATSKPKNPLKKNNPSKPAKTKTTKKKGGCACRRKPRK
ncbi:MAG: hypothetical protein ACYS8I_00450 [Planctomycetota bacterium]|jgi:hypothetical protein